MKGGIFDALGESMLELAYNGYGGGRDIIVNTREESMLAPINDGLV